MPSLQVRELPEHIYRRLKEEAENQHRSIAQQAVAAIARGLSVDPNPKARRMALIETIRSESSARGKAIRVPDPVQMIREDRNR